MYMAKNFITAKLLEDLSKINCYHIHFPNHTPTANTITINTLGFNGDDCNTVINVETDNHRIYWRKW